MSSLASGRTAVGHNVVVDIGFMISSKILDMCVWLGCKACGNRPCQLK